MTNPINLPVLFLSDVVVLPGMVVRVELDEPARAAIDAAQARHPRHRRECPCPGRAAARGPLRVVRRRGERREGGPLRRRGAGRGPQGGRPGPHRQRRERPRRGLVGRGRGGRRRRRGRRRARPRRGVPQGSSSGCCSAVRRGRSPTR
ncbi:hypothetical protein [Nocardioides convexus]|uniref:hypothetical protein n=1 Tax=Nocardioides convexus TaxID=2712224 RepID=UPI0024189661|nr:hypothetical protein [Nocardioides convexus]